MTTTITRRRPRLRVPAAHRSGETLVFAGATGVGLVHALDDAFVHRGAGLPIGQHAAAALVSFALGVGAVAAFPSLRPALRAAIAFAFGVLATINGFLHVSHIRADGASGGDFTGVLVAAAGIVLIGLAAWIPWRHRGEGPARPALRWTRRVLAGPAALLAILFILLPIGMAMFDTHKWREPIGPAPSGYAEVGFEATDGLDLEGWYRPSENGAAVLVVHGGGGDRTGAMNHARMLAAHGYGVLVYDARGRGESQGNPNGYGWDWPKDVAGALAFLHGRPDVDDDRIGALGLSTGADVLIEVAAERPDIKALVSDGAAAGSFEDWYRYRGAEPLTAIFWTQFAALRVLSGDKPGPALEDLIQRIPAPVLLVSAAEKEEHSFNVLYDEAAGDRDVQLWDPPGVTHTHAIHSHRAAYEKAVVAHLDRALGG
jgi:dienelactone hydrolase